MLYLHHETFNQANIPSGNAQNRGDCLLIREIVMSKFTLRSYVM
jgi:hypothetical protein